MDLSDQKKDQLAKGIQRSDLEKFFSDKKNQEAFNAWLEARKGKTNNG